MSMCCCFATKAYAADEPNVEYSDVQTETLLNSIEGVEEDASAEGNADEIDDTVDADATTATEDTNTDTTDNTEEDVPTEGNADEIDDTVDADATTATDIEDTNTDTTDNTEEDIPTEGNADEIDDTVDADATTVTEDTSIDATDNTEEDVPTEGNADEIDDTVDAYATTDIEDTNTDTTDNTEEDVPTEGNADEIDDTVDADDTTNTADTITDAIGDTANANTDTDIEDTNTASIENVEKNIPADDNNIDEQSSLEAFGSGLMVAAAAADDAAPDPANPTGQAEETKDYELPAGSAYIYEIGDVVQYTNTDEGNAIQNALADALTYITQTKSVDTNQRTATIVVSDGTYQGGLKLDRADETNSVLETLINQILQLQTTESEAVNLRIVAADSFDTDENGNLEFHANSAGNVKLEGDISFAMENLNLLLAGIYLSTHGTVTTDGLTSLELQGTSRDDTIQMKTSNTSELVKVDSGKGNDVLELDINKKTDINFNIAVDPATIGDTIDSFMGLRDISKPNEIGGALGTIAGELYNLVQTNLAEYDSSKEPTELTVQIDMGEGDDVADVKLIDATDIAFTPAAAEGSALAAMFPNADPTRYQFGFGIDIGSADVQLNGNEGNDRLSVSGGRNITLAASLSQAVMDSIKGSDYASRLPVSDVQVNGGAGDDILTVDTTVAYSTYGGVSVSANGGTDYDRLHLSGKLDNGVGENERIKLNNEGNELTLKTMAEISLVPELTEFFGTENVSLKFRETLMVDLNNFDALTDQLQYKRRVVLDSSTNETAQSLTDYVVSPIWGSEDAQTETKTGTLHFTLPAGLRMPEGELLLSNLVVDLSQANDKDTLVIEELLAEGLNVLLRADELARIEITGIIRGKNILISLEGEDAALAAIDTRIVEDDLNEEFTDTIELELGFYEAQRDLSILVADTAKLYAQQVIDMRSKLRLNKAFIPAAEYIEGLTDKNLNPVTFKFGESIITIEGTLQAGGTVHVRNAVTVDIDVGNELLQLFIPVAIAGTFGHTKLIVSDEAKIISGRAENEIDHRVAGVVLEARTEVLQEALAGGGVVPFTIGLGMVDFITEVTVKEFASIISGGDVELFASSFVSSVTSGAGKPNNVWDYAQNSGMYIAGSFVFVDTSATIADSAVVEAKGGDVTVAAVSDVFASAVSVAIPVNPSDIADQFTVRRGIGFVESLAGVQTPAHSGSGGWWAARFTGSQSIGNLYTSFFNDAANAGQEGTPMAQAPLQLTGALTISYLEHRNIARIDTAGTVKAFGTVKIIADASAANYQRADGSMYKKPAAWVVTATKPAPNAVGAAIGIGIFTQKNQAELLRGVVESAGLTLISTLHGADSHLIVKSGHIPADKATTFGLGGAIAVHVISVDNLAKVAQHADVTLSGGGLVIRSVGSGDYRTVGDASAKRPRFGLSLGSVILPFAPAYDAAVDSTGIGAGIAVEVLGVNAMAVIEDGAMIRLANGQTTLDEIIVIARFAGASQLEARAGAAGGTSVVPVVATSVSSVVSGAQLGSGEALRCNGNIHIEAGTAMNRALTADAKSIGGGVGIGAAVGVSVVDDEATANLKRKLKGKSLNLKASSISRMKQNIKAGSKGATPPTSPNPLQTAADAKQAGFDQMMGINDGTPDPDGEAIQNLFAEESPTNKNESIMKRLTDLLTKFAGRCSSGKATPESVTQMAANRPKAQTAEGNIQVAASLALNIHRNLAQALVADDVEITTDEDMTVQSTVDTDAVIYADSSATNSTQGVGVAVAINYVEHTNKALIGTGKLNIGGNLSLTADIVEAAEKDTVEDILAALLKYLGNTEGSELLIRTLVSAKGYASLDEMLKQESAYAALSSTDQEKVRQSVIDALIAQFKDEPFETSAELFGDLVDDAFSEFVDMLISPEFLLKLVTGDFRSQFENYFKSQGLTAKVTFEHAWSAVVTAMTARFGNPSEVESVGNHISTSAVSGVGAANVGVAGSAAIAVINYISQATIADLTNALADDINVNGVVTLRANGAQRVYTTASASAASNGLPEKNKGKTTAADATGKSVGVGASFAITIVDADATASLGERRTLLADALEVTATVQNDIDTVSVAGQDPIGRQRSPEIMPSEIGNMKDPTVNNTSTKDIAVDASVALNVIDNQVHALLGEGVTLTLTGGDVIETYQVIGQTDDGKDIHDMANLYVRAYQRGQTYAGASGFAMAGSAAVGAGVAANLASSDVKAEMRGSGSVSGKVSVTAVTANEDESVALAMVTGASLDRYFEKLRGLVTLANGTNATRINYVNSVLMNKLNGKLAQPGSQLIGRIVNYPTLLQLLLSVPITIPTTPDASAGGATASGALSEAGVNSGTGAGQDQNAQKVNVAAAAAVNITKHETYAAVFGDFSAFGFDIKAENRANFRTYATGATITSAADLNTNNISASVGVSCNANTAAAEMDGTITANGVEDGSETTYTGDIVIDAALTQNQDGKYRGLLAVQSIAGAIGGNSGAVGLAGAVSVLIDRARADALLGGHVHAGDITVTVSDKSKNAIRAGAVQAGGQSVGIGLSAALIYAENEITAAVKNDAVVGANSLTVRAQKLKVGSEDYQFPMDLDTVFTVNASGENAGIVNIEMSSNGGTNNVQLNLSTDDLLKVLDTINYLASVNYYIEAIGGSIAAGETSTLALAGAIAALYANGETNALIGENSNVSAYIDEGTTIHSTGKLTIRAANGSKAVAPVQGSAEALANSAIADKTSKAVNDLTIHAVSFSLGGGTAGVGVAVAVVNVSSDVRAFLRGTLDDMRDAGTTYTPGVKQLTIEAVSDFKNVIAATLATGAGAVGVSASVAVSRFDGTTYAAIEKTALIRAGAEGATVQSLVDHHATAFATAIAAGGVGVNGAVAVAVNRSRTETFVAQNIVFELKTISDLENVLEIAATVNSYANAYLLGFSLGGVNVGLGAAVSVLAPTIYTYLGETPRGSITSASQNSNGTGECSVKTLRIINSINTSAEAKLLSVGAGGVAVNGNVLLVFNHTDAVAGINNTRFARRANNDLTVSSVLNAKGLAELASATAGAATVGATVSYVLLDARNEAMAALSWKHFQANSLTVYAGGTSEAVANSMWIRTTTLCRAIFGKSCTGMSTSTISTTT